MRRLALAITLGMLGALLAIAPASAQYGGNPPPPPGPPAGCPVQGGPPAETPPCHPHGKVVGTPPASAAGGQARAEEARLDMRTVASTTQDSLPLTVAAALLLAGTGGVLLRRRRGWFAN